MKVRIRNHDHDEIPPLPGAVRGEYVFVDRRTVKDPANLPINVGNDWYRRGRNHRVVDGMIEREITAVAWFVSVDRIEDLIELAEHADERSILVRSDGTIDVEGRDG